MIKVHDLIPKHKFDASNIDILKTINKKDVEPILKDLMEWIQDINWPIAQELIKVLPRFHKELIPIIRDIFNTDDGDWKMWTLKLIKKFPQESILLLKADIERIAYHPTDSEVYEEVDDYAKEVLSII